jgi:Nucleotidyl transferase AbiEii toxin, Type IV TA system
MFGTSLSFQEFAVAEGLPLASIREAVLEFLRDRDDVLVFGAQAVNRIYQLQVLPATQRIAGVLVMAPAELIASKVVSYHSRRGKPKAGTDWRDIAMLLLKFPELKENSAVVTDVLVKQNADETTLALWRDLAQQSIQAEDDEDEFE